MKPIFQTITHDNRGDCHRAAVASIFDLEIEQVPHFRLFDDDTWGVPVRLLSPRGVMVISLSSCYL